MTVKQMGDKLAVEVLGFDANLAVDSLAELANKGIAMKKSDDAKSTSAADDEVKANAAIRADVAATDACTMLMIAQNGPGGKSDDKTVAARKAVAQQASAAQDAAAIGLSQAAVQKRADAAQAASKAASDDWANNPSNYAKEARATCAQNTATKAISGSGQIVTLPNTSKSAPYESSFIKKVASSVEDHPVIWGVGAVGFVGAIALGLKHAFGKRRR